MVFDINIKFRSDRKCYVYVIKSMLCRVFLKKHSAQVRPETGSSQMPECKKHVFKRKPQKNLVTVQKKKNADIVRQDTKQTKLVPN